MISMGDFGSQISLTFFKNSRRFVKHEGFCLEPNLESPISMFVSKSLVILSVSMLFINLPMIVRMIGL